METILITGGAGFIGSNFIYHIIKKYPDMKVVCVDNLTYAGNIATLSQALNKDNFSFYRANICDREAIYKLFEKESPNYVVNFAAESHVDRSILNPELFLQTNVIGTSILMDATIKYGVERFHQISTDEVYGDLPLDRPDLLFTENTPLHTSSPYSSSKAGADLLVKAYVRTYGLPATITCCSNNYGPYQFPEKLIPLMITKARNNENLPIYGDGKNIRDWLYVEDHCNAIDMVLFNGKIGETYNIGGHNEVSNIDVVKTILKILNKEESLITYVKDRKGHDRRYAIDPSKITKELGWTPTISFREGIKSTVDWYVSNSDWINNILSGKYLDINSKIEYYNT